MATADVHGPIDFVLIEFSGDRLTGRVAQALMDLVDRDIIRVYDVLVVGKNADGNVYDVDLGDTAAGLAAGFVDLAWARSGLLSDDDMRLAADALEPGTLAALVVYENTWAIPFVAAAREAGGELVAGARIPAQDVMAALDELESADDRETVGTTT
jgi:hypothetical protein